MENCSWISVHSLSHKTFQRSLYYVQASKLSQRAVLSYALQEIHCD